MSNRIEKLQESMRENGIDIVAIGPGANMDWLVGFHPHADERPCLLLVGPNGAGFLIPALNAGEARKATDLPFWQWSDETGPGAALMTALRAMDVENARHMALDEAMRTDFSLMMINALPQVKPVSAAILLGSLRMIKDESEIAELKKNALIADAAIIAARGAVRAGMRECDLANIIKEHFDKVDAKTEFCIVANARNAAFPHHHTDGTIINSGEAFLIDTGGRTGLYPSDITRMQAIGEVSEDYLAVHAVVEAAVVAALEAARPGVEASEVDKAARDVITAAGYGDYFVHRTGHGIGIEGHEGPFITATSQTILKCGMAFSIEPGIYIEGKFGIRLEEIVVLREHGPEILSELSRDLEVIEHG